MRVLESGTLSRIAVIRVSGLKKTSYGHELLLARPSKQIDRAPDAVKGTGR